MYSLDSYVLYGTDGVCRISDIRREKFYGNEKEYYILKPVESGSATVYVPTDNQKLINKMKRILTADEIMLLIRGLPDEDIEWLPDNRQRGEQYRVIFERDDRSELLNLIKTIYHVRTERLAEGKKLRVIDENAMHRAERRIYSEFALVLDLKPDEVVPFILHELHPEELDEAADA